MVGYLVKRVIFLVLFVAALLITPVASFFGILVYFAILGFSFIKHANEDSSVSPMGYLLLIVAGIGMFIWGLNIMQDISSNFVLMEFFIIASCSLVIIGSGNLSKKLVYEDRCYYMDDRIDLATKFYPYLLIIAGVLRIVIEAALTFFYEYVGSYEKYLEIGITVGIVLFVFSLAMYILRTMHVFVANR